MFENSGFQNCLCLMYSMKNLLLLCQVFAMTLLSQLPNTAVQTPIFSSFLDVTYRLKINKVSSSKNADCKLDATLDADATQDHDAGVFFLPFSILFPLRKYYFFITEDKIGMLFFEELTVSCTCLLFVHWFEIIQK